VIGAQFCWSTETTGLCEPCMREVRRLSSEREVKLESRRTGCWGSLRNYPDETGIAAVPVSTRRGKMKRWNLKKNPPRDPQGDLRWDSRTGKLWVPSVWGGDGAEKRTQEVCRMQEVSGDTLLGDGCPPLSLTRSTRDRFSIS